MEELVEPASSPPDTALAAGRFASFEELYRSCREGVYAYVYGMLRDQHRAEDVTATVFERAYRRRHRFDRRRGEARAWIFGVARNAALDELRHEQRRARRREQ